MSEHSKWYQIYQQALVSLSLYCTSLSTHLDPLLVIELLARVC